MKALIFGSQGQDGYYLTSLLSKHNIDVIGISRHGIQQLNGSVSDRTFVQRLVKTHQADFIFHLAANSTTQHAFLLENYETISTGALNILEAVYRYSPHSKVFIAGSGLQFINQGIPITENTTFEARDAYSLARIQSVYSARYYRSLGIRVYVGYLFNHDSPLREERHINQKIVRAAQRIALGGDNKLPIGDLHARKEFSFAGDIVRGIWQLMSNDQVFETVIGSGVAHTIAEWLTLCFDFYRLDWRDYVVPLSGYVSDYHILVSDPSRLKALGWEPELNISSLAHLMLTNQTLSK